MPGPEDTKMNTTQSLPLGNYQSNLGERCDNKILEIRDGKQFMGIIPAWRWAGADSKEGFLS